MRRTLNSWVLAASVFLSAIGSAPTAQRTFAQDRPQPEPTVTTVEDLQSTSSSVPTIEWVTYDLFRRTGEFDFYRRIG